jgi:ketosteroid isomerase-like protein
MAANRNLLVQQQFVDAVFAGDGDTIRSLAAPDFELVEGSGMPFAGVYRGADGFLEFLGLFSDTFDLEYLRPVRCFASDDPDRMAFEFELRGVHRATGELFESSLIEAWTFRDGRVAVIKPHYFNVPKPR